MDAPTAFLAALAITAAGGAVTTRTIRLRAKRAAADFQRDGEAYRRTQDRRRETYVEFSMTAGRIADAVALWADMPAAARPGVLDEARAHLQELRTRHAAVLLDSSPAVREAAAAVVANSERLVDGLDLDADPAPELLTLALSERQSLPFLRACREYREAESAPYFGVAVRRAPRLSTR
ncbi:hypothetical protein ACFYZ0_18175 [Streptomyces sp. NPDC001708]|uniref:hypothetical protein n=1 Tax=Streptomyces sp. NPDC001708 TaxID=3364602 RepID=UPI003698270A